MFLKTFYNNLISVIFHYINKNKYKKNFYKIRTSFYQFYIDKILPSKNIFNIANILNLNNSLNQN